MIRMNKGYLQCHAERNEASHTQGVINAQGMRFLAALGMTRDIVSCRFKP